MENIINYFKGIIILLMGIEIINLIIPENSFKGYIKYVSGLIIITALIRPVTGDKMFSFENIYESKTQSEEFSYKEKVKENYIENIKNEIYDKFGINIDVTVDENYRITSVTSKDTEDLKEVEAYLGI